MEATEKQIQFLTDLMAKKDLFKSPRYFDAVNAMDAEELAAHNARIVKMAKEDRTRCSGMIDALLKLPDREGAKLQRRGYNNNVPAGRYAVEGSDGTTDFYKVDKPEEGRWAGYTFVKLLIASGGHGVESLSEQRVRGDAAQTILRRIEEAGVRESMEAFGKAIGSCGHCGRVLTNEESRAFGIGPVCAAKMGW